jgi:hypothetical protein
MQNNTEPKMKWTLILDHVIRAHSIILPATMDELEVLEHIRATHKNRHRWPFEPKHLELIGHEVKLAYVKVNKPVRVTQTASSKTFTQPAYTYERVKVYDQNNIITKRHFTK